MLTQSSHVLRGGLKRHWRRESTQVFCTLSFCLKNAHTSEDHCSRDARRSHAPLGCAWKHRSWQRLERRRPGRRQESRTNVVVSPDKEASTQLGSWEALFTPQSRDSLGPPSHVAFLLRARVLQNLQAQFGAFAASHFSRDPHCPSRLKLPTCTYCSSSVGEPRRAGGILKPGVSTNQHPSAPCLLFV